MAEPKKQDLPEERFPIPESLSGLFQKKELNDKHLWLVGTLTRHITRQDSVSDHHYVNPDGKTGRIGTWNQNPPVRKFWGCLIEFRV